MSYSNVDNDCRLDSFEINVIKEAIYMIVLNNLIEHEPLLEKELMKIFE